MRGIIIQIILASHSPTLQSSWNPLTQPCPLLLIHISRDNPVVNTLSTHSMIRIIRDAL